MLTEIRISRSALHRNVRAFRRVIGPKVALMAVVKSNAYGHGVGECVPIFAQAGVDWFGVASVTEALALRQQQRKKSILVLSYVDGDANALVNAIRQGIRLPAYTLDMLQRFDRAAKKARHPAYIHVKFDTGTSRIGFLPIEVSTVLKLIPRLHHVVVEGLYSHFADVESRRQGFAHLQVARFRKVAATLERVLHRRLLKHLDCSAGVLMQPDTHYDMVRVGMSLYGVLTAEDKGFVKHHYPNFRLQPALAWHTQVIQVQRVPPGTTVGYSRMYRTRRATTLAVLPVGYWEGLDRRLSNVGYVGLRNVRAPIRGRVCMNLTMVDATGLAKLRVGESVELIGKRLTAEQHAGWSGTIPYETLTRLNPLIPRRVVA